MPRPSPRPAPVTIAWRPSRRRASPSGARAQLRHAHVAAARVRLEALDAALARADLADRRALRRGVAHLLVGHGLEELADPEPAAVARRAGRRQDVVGADRLVAVGDRRALAEEERAVVAASARGTSAGPGEDLDVLVGVARRPAPPPARASRRRGPRRGRATRRRRSRRWAATPASWRSTSRSTRSASVRRGGDEHGRRGRAVLCLADQVGRDDLGVGVLVGDHEDLRRPGEQVDARPRRRAGAWPRRRRRCPGPTSRSTRSIDSVPRASAASAWTPPRT